MTDSPGPHAATVPAVTASGAAVFLGTLAPDTADIDRLVRRRREAVERHASGAPNPNAILFAHDVLDFDTYLHTVENFTKLAKELSQTGSLAVIDTWAMRRVLGLPMKPRTFTPDLQGWLNHLCETHPAFLQEIDLLARPSAFPEETREGHSLVVAPANWGKSELLKALVFHQVSRGDAGVVVLDPGGDLVRQIARWPELARTNEGGDRLVYVEPELADGFTVGLNPFDGKGLDDRHQSIVAGILTNAVQDIVADLSANMKNLAMNCLTVLLSRPGSTLWDFLLLLQPEPRGEGKRPSTAPPPVPSPDDLRRQELLAAGRAYPRRAVASFFQSDLPHEYYASTRAALRSRLSSLLNLVDVEAMVDGPATIDLEAALNARKVVLVNLAKFGPDGSADIGRLFVALVASIGRRRGVTPDAARVPVHLFVDEATTMVSEDMVKTLAELRKFGIHQTLAQQVGGAQFSAEQKAVLFKNTAVKFLAPTDAETARLAGLSSAEAGELPDIERGQFWVQWGQTAKLARLKVRSDLAKFSHSVTDAEWQDCVKRQLAAYYRPARPVPAQEPANVPPGGDPPPEPLKVGAKRVPLKRSRARE